MIEDIETIKNLLNVEPKEEAPMGTGHRSRVKEAVEMDPEFFTFSDHEILEYLLFATNARCDTKPIAHDLMNIFGSFSAVLRATPKELMQVSSIGEKSARMLSSIIPASRRAEESRIRGRSYVSDPRSAARYIYPQLANLPYECIYMISADTNDRVIQTDLIATGSVAEANLDLMKLINYAARNGAAKIIIAHNHPAGTLRPSSADIDATCRMVIICSLVNIIFVDHIIISNNKYFSFIANNIMESVYNNCELVLGATDMKELRNRNYERNATREGSSFAAMSYEAKMQALQNLYSICKTDDNDKTLKIDTLDSDSETKY